MKAELAAINFEDQVDMLTKLVHHDNVAEKGK